MAPRRPARGLSLIDALLAFFVLSTTALVALQTQATLRLDADVARQRAEAVRLAEDDMEHWRSAYAELADTPQPVERSASAGSNAHYQLTRSVVTSTEPRLKSAVLRVDWLDRRGDLQSVLLASALHGLDPVAAASLALTATQTSPKRPLGRNAAIPFNARDLGDGRSVFKPSPTLAWLFDNASGVVVARCNVPASQSAASLTPEALRSACTAIQGLLLSGYVQFADASMPRDLDLLVRADGGGPLNHECFDQVQADAVFYTCAVIPAGLFQWTGSSTIVPLGWTLGDTAPSLKVCRYSSDGNGDGRIDNIEHPLVYRDVRTALDQQNFIVIATGAACPTGTVEHQPHGASTPGAPP